MYLLQYLASVTFVSMVSTHCHVTSIHGDFQTEGLFCSHDVETMASDNKMVQHQCKLTCIQSSICVATNYNTSIGSCTQLVSPCAVADSALAMKYFLFTQRRLDECYQWRNQTSVKLNNTRLILNAQKSRFVTRLIYQSRNQFGYYPSYKEIVIPECYGGTGSLRINSWSYICELLLVDPGCTVRWQPFNVGDSLPVNIASSGTTATGELTYIASFYAAGYPQHQLIGYYTVETNVAYATFAGGHRTSTTTWTTMLVVL